MKTRDALIRRIRIWLTIFILGLLVSGLTAFPLETELRIAVRLGIGAPPQQTVPDNSSLSAWLVRVHAALAKTNADYPFLAYGTDWLAFAHLVIAIAFIGAWRDPLRNKWLFDFG